MPTSSIRAERRSRLARPWLVAGLLALAACSGSDGDGDSGENDALPRLSARGPDIVDPDGNVVVLRGVNLGSWLFVENWISLLDYPTHGRARVLGQEQGLGAEVDAAIRSVGPGDGPEWLATFEAALADELGADGAADFVAEVARFPSVFDDSDLRFRQLLEDRFGTDERDALLDTFHRAWIQERDIAWIAEQGFNVVRLPIGYRSLVTASDDAPLTELVWNERAFDRLGDVLDWCERYGIYAVVDIQEAPGGANDYSGPPLLYDEPRFQELTRELWVELSRRYEQRNVVAAYSLLAEPFGAPSNRARDDVYDDLIRAIRERGDDHLLVVHDGFSGLWTLPDPAERGWEDVIYSTHLFEFGITTAIEYRLLTRLYDGLFGAAQERQNVPYFIGSFSAIEDANFAYEGAELFVDLFERSGWSWSAWTYRRLDDPIDAELFGTSTSWGVRGRLASPFERPDAYRDDLETLRAKLAAYGDLVVNPNERLLEILRAPTAAAE